MSSGRNRTKELGARLATVEELIEEIVGRIGLLDEQARQAGYRAQLAIEHWNETHEVIAHEGRTPSSAKIPDLQTVVSRVDRRIEKLRTRL